MNGPEHYREAERLLAMQVSTDPEDQGAVIALRLAAQVHATLALAAASVHTLIPVPGDLIGRGWIEATS